MSTKEDVKKLVDSVGMDEILFCLADIEKEKKEQKPTIEKIWIEHILDIDADASFYGEYTDDLTDGVIVRQFDQFYEKLTDEEKEEIYGTGRQYRCFKPYAGGEKVGSEDYYTYGMQDYERMEELEKGNFYFIGIVANCKVKYPIGQGNYRLETVQSGGLWGIETDSEEDYINEAEAEQKEELKNHLEKMNVNTSNFDELAKDIEIKEK